jgi:hypothetical protein
MKPSFLYPLSDPERMLMKALSVQQPFALEILSGQKTIEVRTWDTLHRGDLLICSSGKPAFPKEDMEDLEEEYGCVFLYGYALCVVRLADARLMRKGDDEKALMDAFDPEAYSWILEDVRPVIPFPVKGQQGLFNVDDHLIQLSPFRYDEPVAYVDPASGATIRMTLPPTYNPIASGQWTNGDVLVILGAVAPDRSVDDLLAETVAAIGMEAPEVVEGPVIAGLPTQKFQGTMSGNAIDVYLFGDEQGTYRIIVDALKADRLVVIRN